MAKGKSNVLGTIGFWAFIVGLALAVAFGFMSALGMAVALALMPAVIIILIILGLVVGFLNITAKEILLFLVATIALIVAGNVFEPLTTLSIGNILDGILRLIAALMAPAAIVAAIKALWAVGRPG